MLPFARDEMRLAAACWTWLLPASFVASHVGNARPMPILQHAKGEREGEGEGGTQHARVQ